MEEILLALLRLSRKSGIFHVFGGALRDYLIGKPIADIDVFVAVRPTIVSIQLGRNREWCSSLKKLYPLDDRVRDVLQVSYHIAFFLRVDLECHSIRLKYMTEGSYNVSHLRIFFQTKENLSSHIDVVQLMYDLDYKINTLYYHNDQLKTFLPKHSVNEILFELQNNLANEASDWFPVKRVEKMKAKGFYLKEESGDIKHELRTISVSEKVSITLPEDYSVTGRTESFERIQQIFKTRSNEIFTLQFQRDFSSSTILFRGTIDMLNFESSTIEVNGKSVEDLQEKLMISTIRKGNALYHDHGKIIFCPKEKHQNLREASTRDIYNLIEAFLNPSKCKFPLLYFARRDRVRNPLFTLKNYHDLDFDSQDLIFTFETLASIKDNMVSVLPLELRSLIYEHLLW